MITIENFKNYLFYVGVVRHESDAIYIKVGNTEETCRKSNTLKVPKMPWARNDFYRSLGPQGIFVYEELKKHDFINFGDSDSPEQESEIVEHRFVLNVPPLPITIL